jgi:hypothetical protein
MITEDMVSEDPNQQSTVGKLSSGYMKVTGHTNIFGSIVLFIFGGLMVLIGIVLGLLFGKFSFLLMFLGFGLLMILLGYFTLKWSKRMREGKYYRVGKGWVKPE